jgi:hypothetical protein
MKARVVIVYVLIVGSLAAQSASSLRNLLLECRRLLQRALLGSCRRRASAHPDPRRTQIKATVVIAELQLAVKDLKTIIVNWRTRMAHPSFRRNLIAMSKLETDAALLPEGWADTSTP